MPRFKKLQEQQTIFESIKSFESNRPPGLNGFILLLHIGTDKRRTDKFYHILPQLVRWLKQKGYLPVKVDELLGN